MYIFFIFLMTVLNFLVVTNLFSERFPIQTELDQINFMDQLLSTSENLKLQVLDDFESNNYFVFDPPTPLYQLEVIYKHPGLSTHKEQKRAFELEQIMVGGWSNTKSFNKSLSFYYNVDIPGKNHFRIQIKEPKYIQGKPLKYSLWIYNNSYSGDKFFLIWKINNKEFLLPVITLNWIGWKRIENFFPKNFLKVPKLNKLPGYFQFIGFFIQTFPKQERGNREILIDHLLILTDHKYLDYPGADILDNF